MSNQVLCFLIVGNKNPRLEFLTMKGSMFADVDDESRISLDFPMNDPVPINPEEEIQMLNLLKDYKICDVLYSSTAKKLLIRLDDSHTR